MSGPTAYYEVRWRPSDSDGEWTYKSAPADSTSISITGTDREKAYVIQARSVGPSGLKSIWVNISHTVAGNIPPETPSSVTALGVADGVRLVCDFMLPLAADVDVCVERSTAFAGPFSEVLRARALTITVPEKVDGLFYYRLRTRNFRGQYSTYSAIVSARPAVVNTSLDSYVLNPNFDQGLDQWITDPGYYIDSGVNSLIGNMAMHGPGSTANARVLNSKIFTVKAGQEWFVSGAMNSVGSPNGYAAVGLFFWDKDGNPIDDRGVSYTQAQAISGSTWRIGSKRIVVPFGAVKASVTGLVLGHTSGYWCFDAFKVSPVSDFITGTVSGENAISNHNFSENEGAWPTAKYDLQTGDPITDGWFVERNTLSAKWPNTMASGLETSTADSGLRMAFIGDTNLSGSTLGTGIGEFYLATKTRFAVDPGQRYWIEYDGNVDAAASRPSGVTYTVYMGLWYYDKDDNLFAFGGYIGLNVATAFTNSIKITVPAGAAYARGIVGISVSNSSGSPQATAWAMCHSRFRSLKARRIATLDDGVIDDGTVYGRTGNVDLIVDSGTRRIGLNVRGSRNILGGARNCRSSLVGGFSAVRTAVALSANSSGQVSVNAHSLEISGETVVYNAVSNAVTGLTVGITYVIFTLDPYLDGGTRTYFAQTTVLSAQQAGEGAVFMGNITIPAAGSSTGGDSGTGGPGSFCVDSETMLPDGRYLKDIGLGDLVECVNVSTGETGFYPLLRMSFGEEECFRLSEEGGCSVIQSKSTPMDLPNGSVCFTPEMFGKSIVIKTIDGIAKSIVWDLQYVGVRKVLKPDFGDRMFFAGERAEACIATHNLNNKP